MCKCTTDKYGNHAFFLNSYGEDYFILLWTTKSGWTESHTENKGSIPDCESISNPGVLDTNLHEEDHL